jgi:hypothetical protein
MLDIFFDLRRKRLFGCFHLRFGRRLHSLRRWIGVEVGSSQEGHRNRRRIRYTRFSYQSGCSRCCGSSSFRRLHLSHRKPHRIRYKGLRDFSGDGVLLCEASSNPPTSGHFGNEFGVEVSPVFSSFGWGDWFKFVEAYWRRPSGKVWVSVSNLLKRCRNA